MDFPAGDPDAILGKFEGEDVEIELPVGYEAYKLRWFSVWCRMHAVSFGDVMFETGRKSNGGASGKDDLGMGLPEF